MAEKLSRTHAQAIEAMKDQLLIVLIERLGGEASINVEEIDATGDRNLLMSIDGTRFHFAVRKKSAPAQAVREMIINRPDYDEH